MPYDKFKLAALMGFSGVTTPQQLPRVWSLFLITKDVDTHHMNIFTSMKLWASTNGTRIDLNVHIPKISIEDWVAVRMTPGKSIATYQTAGKGISPLALIPWTPLEMECIPQDEYDD